MEFSLDFSVISCRILCLLLFLFSLQQTQGRGLRGNKTIATDPRDKEVLEQFYHSTAGPTWLKNTGWLSGDPCQSMWYGVSCAESGNVIEMTLSNNLLAGELPSILSDLKSLQILSLSGNAIGGTLPSSIFTMKTIKILNLDNNKISGSLPPYISLPYLTNLSISQNQLQGYLPSEWNCPNLEVISLSSNMLQGPLPVRLSTLLNLQYLDLSQNFLSGLFPDAYSSLVSLETLWLFTNRFNGSAIPTSWNKLIKMKNFQADYLSGDIPDLIGVNWSDLEVLIIVDGQLTGSIPDSFCHLKKLQYLHLFRNSITGPIPQCFCNLPASSLISINLSYNQITGTIPDCFDSFHDLRYLYLENNNLTGHLPTSLSSCKNLYTIDLSNNRLSGSIPSIYANLKDTLNWFELDLNNLNVIENGLEDFFKIISTKFCSLYGNPWSCPLPDYFVANEFCTVRGCEKCNTIEQHNSCELCLKQGLKDNCGWCNEGRNCLGGYSGGPYYPYKCDSSDWLFNKTSC